MAQNYFPPKESALEQLVGGTQSNGPVWFGPLYGCHEGAIFEIKYDARRWWQVKSNPKKVTALLIERIGEVSSDITLRFIAREGEKILLFQESRDLEGNFSLSLKSRINHSNKMYEEYSKRLREKSL